MHLAFIGAFDNLVQDVQNLIPSFSCSSGKANIFL